MNDIEKAIEYLKEPIGKPLEVHYKAIKLAISALEKQIPKKPIKITYSPLLNFGWEYGCPSCSLAVGTNSNAFDYTDEEKYCSSCGQKLDWSVEE